MVDELPGSRNKLSDDIIVQIKKNMDWAVHVIRRYDNRWTTRVTEWMPRDVKKAKATNSMEERIKKFLGERMHSNYASHEPL